MSGNLVNPGAVYCVGVLRALANWWDAVELWVTQLQFPIQVMLAVLVVLPLCWAAAAALDRAVDVTVRWAGSRRPDRGC